MRSSAGANTATISQFRRNRTSKDRDEAPRAPGDHRRLRRRAAYAQPAALRVGGRGRGARIRGPCLARHENNPRVPGLGGAVAGAAQQLGAHELVELAVEHALGVADLHVPVRWSLTMVYRWST